MGRGSSTEWEEGRRENESQSHQEPLELIFAGSQVEERSLVLLVELRTLAREEPAVGNGEERHS